jgi:energy-coupling factor transporter ATP-binding protein EcfA2
VLKTENLTLHLPEKGPVIFEDISFELHEGEIGFVSGPAGSGKTTLGLTLCGCLPLWAGSWELEGRVELFGNPVEQGSNIMDTGLILENPYTQLSGLKRNVFHELAFPLECRGAESKDMPARIEQYARLLDVAHLLNRSIRTLSGGELQRVLIAGTLLTQPRFLFLDRPFTEIDTEFRPTLMEIIRTHIRDNRGAALISEDPWLFPDRQYDHEIRLGTSSDETLIRDLPEKVPSHKKPSQSGKTILSVDNISFAYDEHTPVLHDFSFSLSGGEIVLVGGPNGAGKTTLAKLIAGILNPRKGSIILNGTPAAAMKEWEIMSMVGLSLQNPALHLCRKTVGEELELAEKWGHAPGKFVEILGLEKLFDRHPLELSQAEKKRLGMALACGERRLLLILDEPSQYQDSESFIRMSEAIDKLAGEGRAVLIITHDPRLFSAFPEAGVIHLKKEN